MVPRYEYATVNTSHYPNPADAANQAAKNGWRTVAVIPSRGPGYADSLLVEKPFVPEIIILADSTNPPKEKRQWWNPKFW